MKYCAVVKRSCAEKLVLYLIIIMTNIKSILVYKDQRSPEKIKGIGISCTNGKNLKPKCKSSVWSTASFKNVVNVKNILCNFFPPIYIVLYSMFLFIWVIEEIQAQCLWLLSTRNFLYMLQLIIINSKFDELKNYTSFTYTVEND